MNDNQEKLLLEKGLSFFGTITASVTHEMNNVISIIDQVAGLMEDMLMGSEAGNPVKTENLKTVHERITRQTARGVDFIKRLNRFAHSTDEPIREIELNSLIENLMALCQRFADMKRASLVIEYSPVQINLSSDPFALQHALFLCLKEVLDNAGKDDIIRVDVTADDRIAQVRVEGPARGDSEAAGFDPGFAEFLMQGLSGSLETIGDNNGRSTFELQIPIGT